MFHNSHPFQKRIHNRINKIVDVIDKGKLSNEGYDSTKQPFFIPGQSSGFKQDFKKLPELPKGINTNLNYIYEIIGNPDVELYITNKKREQWTIMSLTKALSIYTNYCKENSDNRVFDFAYKYMGMGHILVLSCDIQTHNLFYHGDGGSSGYDREYHHKKIINYNPHEYDELYFMNWFNLFKN